MEDVAIALRAFGCDGGFESRVEQGRLERIQFTLQFGRFPALERAAPRCLLDSGLEYLECKLGEKFLGSHLIVIAAIGPEQLGEIGNLAQRLWVDRLGVAKNLFEERLLAQAPDRILIVIDRVDGDGCLGQPVRQRLLLQAERLEALGFELHEPGGADAVHERRIFRGQGRAG